jgi:hypothetical protein
MEKKSTKVNEQKITKKKWKYENKTHRKTKTLVENKKTYQKKYVYI